MERMKYYSLWICLICIGIFIIQLFSNGFTNFFMLTPDALSMPWQFFTAIFLHGNFAHILYNMFALVLFGLILEKLIGSKRFLVLFLVSGVLANVFSFMLYPSNSALGASGAIMGVIGVVAVLKPKMIVWAYNLPMPMFVFAGLWIVGSVMGIFGIGDPSVGHLAHLSGVVIGIFYGLFLRIRCKERKSSNRLVFSRKIVIPEDDIRRWENFYIK